MRERLWGAFHLLELAGKSVNQMCHVEGVVLQNLKKKLMTPKMVRAILEEFEGLGLNLSIEWIRAVHELTGLAGLL